MASFDQFYISICCDSIESQKRHRTSVSEQLNLLSQLTPLCLKREIPAIFPLEASEFNPSIFQEMRKKSPITQTYLLRIAMYLQKHPSVIDQIESCCSNYLLTAPNISIENYFATCRKWISQLSLASNDPLYCFLLEGFSRYSQIPKLMTWYYIDAFTDSVFSLSETYKAYAEYLKGITLTLDLSSINRLADCIHKIRIYFNALGNMQKEGPFENLRFDCCEIINLASALKACASDPLHALLHEVETTARSAVDSLPTRLDDVEKYLKQLLRLEAYLRNCSGIPVLPPIV